jgi:hypothetical protein
MRGRGLFRAAHQSYNNFYSEASPARQVEALVGERGSIPNSVARKYVRTIVEVFLGNGYGVAAAAVPMYRDLLERLDTREAGRALRAFTDEGISSLLAILQLEVNGQSYSTSLSRS